jgi:hypothetical protein
VNYLTEVISLGVLFPSVTTPSQRDFVFDFDFNGQNFIRTDLMCPNFVKGGTSSAESRNGLNVNSANTSIPSEIATTNISLSSNVSTSGTQYTNISVSYQFTFDRVNNKILLSLVATGNPNIPTWACLTFRAWTVV